MTKIKAEDFGLLENEILVKKVNSPTFKIERIDYEHEILKDMAENIAKEIDEEILREMMERFGKIWVRK
jgi:hypothetical protein